MKMIGQAEKAAEAAGKKLNSLVRTVSGAESCTGGLVSQLITAAPGSSAYFLGGVVSYSNAAKIRFLGVKPATLKIHGAVSKECAAEMALGAKKRFKSDYAFSITGIAGPDGGTVEKPVGTVYLGLAAGKSVKVFKCRFSGNRAMVRTLAALFILKELSKAVN